jgi:hypothetical protein
VTAPPEKLAYVAAFDRPAAQPDAIAVLDTDAEMVEASRDGRRVYVSNSLYGAWDDQFYPEGVRAWVARLDAVPGLGLDIDPRFFPHGDDFRGLRVHQIGCRAAMRRPTPTTSRERCSPSASTPSLRSPSR